MTASRVSAACRVVGSRASPLHDDDARHDIYIKIYMFRKYIHIYITMRAARDDTERAPHA